jgi:hypothetical protein
MRLIFVILLLPFLAGAQIIKSDNTCVLPKYCINGTGSNWANSDVYIVGGQPFSLAITMNVTNTAFNPLFSCGGYTSAVKGFMCRIFSTKIQCYIARGGGIAQASSTQVMPTGLHTILVNWNGVANDSIKIYVDGVYFDMIKINVAWIGNSSEYVQFGTYNSGASTTPRRSIARCLKASV